jgi:saccharopine dehydrogenase-like NADP-dependent oxidoreductase
MQTYGIHGGHTQNIKYKKTTRNEGNIRKTKQKVTTLENTKTQTNQIKDNTQYPRVLNQSDTYFTDDEMQLLEKGMKYNLHQKPKKLD